jgi:hypothetical protein
MALPSFPVDALPDWLREFVASLAEATQTPPDLGAMLALAALSTAAARKVEVQVRQGWTEPVNLYIVVAMPPGSRKSPVFSRVTAPLMRWECRALDWARPNIANAEGRRRIAEDIAREAEKIAAKGSPDDMERLTAEAVAASETADAIVIPPPPRLLADDATAEAVASLLAEQDGRLAILSAEGDLFEVLAGRYSKTPNIGVFLKGWSGDDLRVDRKGRPAEHIDKPALTLGLAIQPEVLVTMGRQPGFRERGLVARFLYSLPPSNVGLRNTNSAPVLDAVEVRYSDELDALTTKMAELEDRRTLLMSPAAARCFEAFEAELEPRLRADLGDLGHAADWGAKLAGHTVRIAGLLHLASHYRQGWSVPIEPDTIEDAILIARYLVCHALAVFDLMGADPAMADAGAVVAWLERTDVASFTRRECHRALESRFPRARDLDPALTLLEDRCWIYREEPTRPQSKGGRPPSPTYLVNPHVSWRRNRHNRQNPSEDDRDDGSVQTVGSVERITAFEDGYRDSVPCGVCGAPPPKRGSLGWIACAHQIGGGLSG